MATKTTRTTRRAGPRSSGEIRDVPLSGTPAADPRFPPTPGAARVAVEVAAAYAEAEAADARSIHDSPKRKALYAAWDRLDAAIRLMESALPFQMSARIEGLNAARHAFDSAMRDLMMEK